MTYDIIETNENGKIVVIINIDKIITQVQNYENPLSKEEFEKQIADLLTR